MREFIVTVFNILNAQTRKMFRDLDKKRNRAKKKSKK